MPDVPAYLLITAIPNPEKLEKLQSYISQVMAIHAAAGGKAVGTYSVSEQLVGKGGTKLVAIVEYPDAQIVKAVVEGDAFLALNPLRDEVYLSLDLMISASL